MIICVAFAVFMCLLFLLNFLKVFVNGQWHCGFRHVSESPVTLPASMDGTGDLSLILIDQNKIAAKRCGLTQALSIHVLCCSHISIKLSYNK